jgi:hypothetical protein
MVLRVTVWIDLTQYEDQCTVLVSRVMNEEWCLLGCYAVWLL